VSITDTGAVSMYYFPARDDPARPSGIFTGFMVGTGDGGGGTHTLTLELDRTAILNRIWVIRTIILKAVDTIAFALAFGQNYWEENSLQINDTLHAGQVGASWEYLGAAVVHIPAQNQDSDLFMRVIYPNAAFVRRLWVQGEFYDQATMRKYEVGPEINF